jgi:hypothetical protein
MTFCEIRKIKPELIRYCTDEKTPESVVDLTRGSSACGELACPELVEGVESGMRKIESVKVSMIG